MVGHSIKLRWQIHEVVERIRATRPVDCCNSLISFAQSWAKRKRLVVVVRCFDEKRDRLRDYHRLICRYSQGGTGSGIDHIPTFLAVAYS